MERSPELPPPPELFGWHQAPERPPVPLQLAELPPGYRLELVHRYEEPLFGELIQRTFFGPTGSLRWPDLGVEEDAALRSWRREGVASRPTLRLALRRDEALVGWSFGFADRADGFYMASSAVLDGHRRQGLYTALARATVALCRQAGFHFVHSRHVATNNPILVAKLRLGFRVTGFELTPDMGSLLALEYPLLPQREHALLARSGLVRMEPALAAQLVES